MDSKFTNYIKNRSVIFVGPSPILKEYEYGDWIDSFDIVIRTNGSIFLLENEEFVKDYGRKCDILCMNKQFMQECKDINLEKWSKEHNIKFFLVKDNNIRHLNSNKVISVFPVKKELEKKIKGPFFGAIILEQIRRLFPKELWLTGIDFYSYTKGYVDGYQLNENSRQTFSLVNSKDATNKVHDGYKNNRYIYSLVTQGQVKTHDLIRKAMEKKLENYID